MLACVFSLHGCTSVSWKDSDGTTHHVGLVACHQTELAHGHRIRRYSLGADLRLNGPDSGYTIGFKTNSLLQPEVIEISDPNRLGDAVLAKLQNPEAPTSESNWKFLYFSEPISSRATLARGSCIGLEVRAGELASGFSVGFHQGWQLVGSALEENVVHHYWHPVGNTASEAAVLWKLIPGNGSEAHP